MCIIVIVPFDKEMPSNSTLENCWSSNRDGAGFMYVRDKMVQIRKGYMKFEDLINAMNAEKMPERSNVMIHFRTGTSGGINPQKTHPFPISDVDLELDAVNLSVPIGIMHNGVLCHGSKELSDTQLFIKNTLAEKHLRKLLKTDAVHDLMNRTGSKFSLMFSDGSSYYIGDFKKDEGGIIYSNDAYKTRTTYYKTPYGNGVSWSSGSKWNGYQDWDDNGYDNSKNVKTVTTESTEKNVTNPFVIPPIDYNLKSVGVCEKCGCVGATSKLDHLISSVTVDKVIWKCASCGHVWDTFIFASHKSYRQFYKVDVKNVASITDVVVVDDKKSIIKKGDVVQVDGGDDTGSGENSTIDNTLQMSWDEKVLGQIIHTFI